MFRAGLLLIIRRINSVQTAISIVMRYVDWLLAGSNKPLHVSSRPAAHHQEDQICINSNWYSHVLC